MIKCEQNDFSEQFSQKHIKLIVKTVSKKYQKSKWNRTKLLEKNKVED